MSVTRNPNLGPSHARARRRRLFYIKSIIILILLITLIFISAYLSGHRNLIIKKIIIEGNDSVSSEIILEIVNQEMSGKYGYLFAKNNYFIFPRSKISKTVLTEIKTIKEINISWGAWQTIKINVLERKPHSVWCHGFKEESSNNCFFVDKDGYIYNQASAFSGSVFVRLYGNVFDINPLGQSFLPSEIYKQIFKLIHLLDEKNLKVVEINYINSDFIFLLKDGLLIKFNLKEKLEISFGNLFLALEDGSLNLESGAGDIAYIDLRFTNKIVIGKKEIKNEE